METGVWEWRWMPATCIHTQRAARPVRAFRPRPRVCGLQAWAGPEQGWKEESEDAGCQDGGAAAAGAGVSGREKASICVPGWEGSAAASGLGSARLHL